MMRKSMVDEAKSVVLDVYLFGQTLHQGKKFRQGVPPEVWHSLSNYEATHPVTLATVRNSNLSRQARVGITFV